MIIKVQNEAPFQVLTGAYTIGPSSTGYELQVGATPQSFTTLFSVGANTTRMVTNVANGSYYRLKNNVGEVQVNWSRTCVEQGGGGDMSNYYTKDETDEAIQEAISGISLDGYWTSAQTEDAISAATSGKADAANVTASSSWNFPFFNSQGIITGSTVLNAGYDHVNGKTEPYLRPWNNHNFTIYAPESVGTAGDILVSTGNGAPVWSAMTFITSADVETQILSKNYITSADTADFLDAEDGLVISTALNNLNSTKVSSSSVSTIWKGTQAEYDAETASGQTADPATFYIIVSSN